MTRKLADDCFVLDKDRLPHGEALAILKSRVRPVVDVEEVTLDNAAGRYLAEAIVAPRPIPSHDNAAVDGYSFVHTSYDEVQGTRFKVVGEASAGHPFTQVPPRDSAVRIFTGAVMPSGHDTVAMQEFVGVEQQRGYWFATVPDGLKLGANRRLAGETPSRVPSWWSPVCGSDLKTWRPPPPAVSIGFAATRRFGLPSFRPVTRSCARETSSSKARSMTPTHRCWTD